MSKTGVIKIQNEREIINISSDSFNIYYIIQKYVTVVSSTSITIEIFLSFIARIVPTFIFVGMRRFFLNLGAIDVLYFVNSNFRANKITSKVRKRLFVSFRYYFIHVKI